MLDQIILVKGRLQFILITAVAGITAMMLLVGGWGKS